MAQDSTYIKVTVRGGKNGTNGTNGVSGLGTPYEVDLNQGDTLITIPWDFTHARVVMTGIKIRSSDFVINSGAKTITVAPILDPLGAEMDIETWNLV